MTSKSAFLLNCLLWSNLFASINALAGGGWQSRPIIPELAKSSEESPTNKRQKWDAMRFLSQSSKFVSMPKLGSPNPTKVQPGDIIWDKSSFRGQAKNNKFTFAPLDDVVMGGVSSSTFVDGTWKGVVSDSNSGGFVGIRSTPMPAPLDFSDCKGVQLRFKGERNKLFKFVVRDSTDFNGVCWTSTFGGDFRLGDECTVKIPLDNMIPTIFARTVPDQTIGKKNIVGFQLTYSKFLFDEELNPKFELGEFDLEVLDLRAY
jgi:hypothetical protein